jgi:hypothetical protein
VTEFFNLFLVLTVGAILAGDFANRKVNLLNTKNNDIRYEAVADFLFTTIVIAFGLLLIPYIAELSPWYILFPIISILISMEFLWMRYRDRLNSIFKSLLFKPLVLVSATVIYFYVSSTVSTELELITSVSPSVFGPFSSLLEFMLSLVFWGLFVMMGLFGVLVLLFILPRKSISKSERGLALITLLVGNYLVFLALVQFTFAVAIPYAFEELFVPNTYHSNKNKDNFRFCFNFPEDSQILLLPSGRVSIATKDEQNEGWKFSVSECEMFLARSKAQ